MLKMDKTNYNKIVNVDCTSGRMVVTILEYTFEYESGHKGAVGHDLEIIDEDTFNEDTSYDSVLEMLMDASECPDEFLVYTENDEDIDDNASYRNWCDAIFANGEQTQVMYDESYIDELDMIREELGLTDEQAYYTTCIGGGRIFDENYKGNFNEDLSAIIREHEKIEK